MSIQRPRERCRIPQTTQKGRAHWHSLRAGRDIYSNTDYGDFSNVHFDHDVVSFDTFASSPRRTLSMDDARVGKVIKNIRLVYDVEGFEKINGHHLTLEYEEAKIEAKNFSVNPRDKTVSNFHANVRGLPLESLLTVGLGENIRAEGLLNGSVSLHFKGAVPTASGELSSEIQDGFVTAPGQTNNPPFGSDLPGHTEWVFVQAHYADLAVDIRSDEHYNMNMTLKAFGNDGTI